MEFDLDLSLTPINQEHPQSEKNFPGRENVVDHASILV